MYGFLESTSQNLTKSFHPNKKNLRSKGLISEFYQTFKKDQGQLSQALVLTIDQRLKHTSVFKFSYFLMVLFENSTIIAFTLFTLHKLIYVWLLHHIHSILLNFSRFESIALT